MKIKILLTTIVALGIIVLNPLISVEASSNPEENINMVVLFTENQIDNNVKEIITKSGGSILSEIPELGGIEVECSPEIIPKINEQNSVESLSPSRIIKIEKNKSIDSSYYEDKGNSYYENNNNSYYEDKGNSYYEDKNNNYYEDNSDGYYNNKNLDEDILQADLYNKYQWDIKKITNNGESFKIELGNHNTVIGIIDSGVDTDHPDLKNNFLGGKNFVPKEFQDNDSETGDTDDVEDRFGHGTEVAGQIAANGRIKGVAPGIGFKCYRVFDEYGETTASICSNAIITAVNDDVKVINLSFGSYYLEGECTWTDSQSGEIYNLGDDMADYTLLKRAIEYAIENGVIVVTAAGNEGLDCSDNKKLAEYFNEIYKEQGFSYTGLIYEEPGSFDGVINVSATDINDNLASYSNYGQGFIDVTAPAGDINDEFDNNKMCITTSIENGYIFDVGTSLSAPKVSGAVGILLCKNNVIKASDVENILYKNCDFLYDLDHNKYYGAGIINVYKLIE